MAKKLWVTQRKSRRFDDVQKRGGSPYASGFGPELAPPYPEARTHPIRAAPERFTPFRRIKMELAPPGLLPIFIQG
jgi:hypothetical protein